MGMKEKINHFRVAPVVGVMWVDGVVEPVWGANCVDAVVDRVVVELPQDGQKETFAGISFPQLEQ
jgi:hypothetical protein